MLLLAARGRSSSRRGTRVRTTCWSGAPAPGQHPGRVPGRGRLLREPDVVFRAVTLRAQPVVRDFLASDAARRCSRRSRTRTTRSPRWWRRSRRLRDATRNPVFQAFIDWQKREWIGDLVQSASRAGRNTRVRFQLGESSRSSTTSTCRSRRDSYRRHASRREGGRQESSTASSQYDAALFPARHGGADGGRGFQSAARRDRRRPAAARRAAAAAWRRPKRRVLVDWNATERRVPARPLRARAVRGAREGDAGRGRGAQPRRAAAHLRQSSTRARHRLAHRLRRVGVGERLSRSGIRTPRSTRMMVGMLGHPEGGAATSTLDPRVSRRPAASTWSANSGAAPRRHRVGAGRRITAPGVTRACCFRRRKPTRSRDQEERRARRGESAGRPQDLAYLIYTSRLDRAAEGRRGACTAAS